jgi:hypothetical protein
MVEQFERETDRVTAQSDDGRTYTVIEYTKFFRHQPISQAAQTLKGTKHYELKDGSPVNWVDDDSFEIVENGEIIRKV